ncbi:hypothetical protein HMPREF9453_01995 [Dialister succinatiphilus YIT 11850]|uniref:Uncharacterized protein n=1 Tax=Dialister succinatiphilus YIT 11850 TaxID=742743 RepID=H1D307_9FIRM|nr:hypothetical protein HMPREF9453_01995 [Dialister succinatiphilus YIT 11850]
MTAFQAEGCGIALTGDEYEVSVTGFTFSAIWHDKHSAVENHTTTPAVRGRSVFPRAKARLSRFYHKRAPSINVRRPQQPSAAEPLSNLRILGAIAPSNFRTLGAIAPSNFRTLKLQRGLSIRRVNLREYSFPPILHKTQGAFS